MFIFNLLSGVALGLGLFFIFCDIFKVPTYKTSSTMLGMERHYTNREASRINSALDQVAIWLSKTIRLRDFKKAEIQTNLNTARMTVTPEMFISTCIVKAGVVAILALPLLPILPIASAVIALFAVVYYFDLVQELKRKVKKHRDAVEFELVQMIFTIERVLQHNRNVILMLQNYRDIAGPEMKQELDITIADMLSGNQEQALSRLEIRVGSIMMSDVCRGLISVIRGDDTAAYWVNLQQKFSAHQRDMLKQKAERIPARVNRLSMALLFAFMALWLGVLIIQMAGSFIEMFEMI